MNPKQIYVLNEKIRKRTLGVKGMSSAHLRKGKRWPVGLEPRETYKDSRETYKKTRSRVNRTHWMCVLLV